MVHRAARVEAVEEMQGLFFGPMPVQDFLDQYLTKTQHPTPPLYRLFQGDMKDKEEKAVYSEFIEEVTQSGLIPGFKIVNASNHKSIPSYLSMYPQSIKTDGRRTQFDELELNFEFKCDANDPFIDPPDQQIIVQSRRGGTAQHGDREKRISEERKGLCFESETSIGQSVRGQLLLYATEWFACQHRLFGFTIFIFYPFARFILWDRSGSVVTERFDLRIDQHNLAEFLWRFVHTSDAGRGHDPTVRKATVEEAQLAKKHLSRWRNDADRHVYVFSVPDGQERREFMGWGLVACPESLTGRATRAYPVYEKATGKTCFLKDSWRAAMTEPEADIIRELNVAGVRNVPLLVCGGDLDQHTLSHVLGVEEDWEFYDSTTNLKRPWWKCGPSCTVGRVHHRFVEDFIGKHLDRFKSSQQLLQVTYDAFIAHEDAFVKCRILHRDVSSNNVMMTQDGHGILNDWDLAKHVSKSPDVQKAHAPLRIGTWQFISTMLLQHPGKPHVVQDDMESFVHVVLYHAFRYLQHTALDDVNALISEVFDENVRHDDGTVTGGKHKSSFFNDPSTYTGFKFAFKESKPLQAWYKFVVRAVAQWHAYEKQLLRHAASKRRLGTQAQTSVLFEELTLAKHDALRKKWEEILSSSTWPDNEKIVELWALDGSR